MLVGEGWAVVSELEKGSKSAVVLATGDTTGQCRVKGRLSEALGLTRQQSGRKPGRNVCSLEPVCLPHPRRPQVSWSCPNRDNARMNSDAGLAAGAGLCEPQQCTLQLSVSTNSCDAFWLGRSGAAYVLRIPRACSNSCRLCCTCKRSQNSSVTVLGWCSTVAYG